MGTRSWTGARKEWAEGKAWDYLMKTKPRWSLPGLVSIPGWNITWLKSFLFSDNASCKSQNSLWYSIRTCLLGVWSESNKGVCLLLGFVWKCSKLFYNFKLKSRALRFWDDILSRSVYVPKISSRIRYYLQYVLKKFQMFSFQKNKIDALYLRVTKTYNC